MNGRLRNVDLAVVACFGRCGATGSVQCHTAHCVPIHGRSFADPVNDGLVFYIAFAAAQARHARGIIRQNLYLSLLVIAVLVVSTTTGVSGIGLAVVIHEGSTLLVIGNALRLLAYQGGNAPRAPSAAASQRVRR